MKPPAEERVAGRFELVREVGRGGMGVVWLARDEVTGELVALKRMLSSAALPNGAAPLAPAGADRFEREADVLSRLSHPRIVRYVAHGIDASGPWLAMEWLEGSDLASVLSRGRVNLGAALEIAAQIAEGLEFLHASGVVHRDVKPSNALLLAGASPRVKLMDFGIARDARAKTVLTTTGAVVGTPLYMAPEQLHGEPATAASDVHACAVVAFELLAGRAPFEAETAFASIGRILLEPAPALARFEPATPAGVASIVARALTKDPKTRPHVRELAAALRAEANAWGLGRTVSASGAVQPIDFTREERTEAVVVVRCADLPVVERVVTELADRRGVPFDLVDGTFLGLVRDAMSPDAALLRAVRLGLDVAARAREAIVVVTSAKGESSTSSVGGLAFARAERVPASRPGVHLDSASASLLEGRFELEHADGYATVLGERSPDDERLLLGRPTPTVGRDAEIAQLVALVGGVTSDGAPRVACVTAHAGQGKTRVRHALGAALRSAPEPPVQLLARFEPDDATIPWSGLVRGLRELAGIVAGDPVERRAASLDALVARAKLTPQHARLLSVLLVVASDGEPARGLSLGDLAREHVHAALSALFRGLAGERALLLLCDDAHWADAESLALVDELVGEPDLAVAVVVFARPSLFDARPELWKRRAPLRLELGSLPIRAAKRLARAALGEEVDASAVDRIVELAAGSPLILEELVRGHARGVAAALSAAASPSVAVVLEARLARLTDSERLAARVAAVVGETFWDELIVRIIGTTAAITVASLDALAHEEVLMVQPTSRFRGAKERSFRHALVREAADAMVPADLRRHVHAETARWLHERAEPDHARVAHHAEAGGLDDLASDAWASAGLLAGNTGAPRVAVEMLERALRLGRPRPANDVAFISLEELYRELGDERRRVRQLARIRRAARRAAEPTAMALADARTARWYTDRGDNKLAEPFASKALEAARAIDAHNIAAEAAITLSAARGRAFDPILDAELERLALQTPGVWPDIRVELMYVRGVASRQRGQCGPAIESYRIALDLIERTNLQTSRPPLIWNALGYALFSMGQLAAARAAMEKARALVRASGIAQVEARITENLANVALNAGDLPGAAVLLDEALAMHRRGIDRWSMVDTLLVRARVSLLAGDLGAAEGLFQECSTLTDRDGSAYGASHEALVHGWLAIARGDRGLALDYMRAAADIGRQVARSLSLVAQAELARLLAQTGSLVAARAEVESVLVGLSSIDGSEWGVETFVAVLDTLELLPRAADVDALVADSTRRAIAYVDACARDIGDAALGATYERREDVRRIRRAAG